MSAGTSIRELAIEMKVNRAWLSGLIRGMGIEPSPGGTALLMDQKQVARIKRRVEEIRKPVVAAG